MRTVFPALLCMWFAACSKQDLTVTDPWVRATAPGQSVAAAYMELNSGKGATLTRVETAAAEAVQIHSMSAADGVMRMREVPVLELPANKPVRLAPGSYHMMLINLRRQLNPGDRVSLKLTLKQYDGGERVIDVDAPVRAGSAE